MDDELAQVLKDLERGASAKEALWSAGRARLGLDFSAVYHTNDVLWLAQRVIDHLWNTRKKDSA